MMTFFIKVAGWPWPWWISAFQQSCGSWVFDGWFLSVEVVGGRDRVVVNVCFPVNQLVAVVG